MQKTSVVALAVISLLAAVTGPVIAEKITADPNAPGQARVVDGRDKPDTRLEQKVTYQAPRKSVKVILADLTKQTGVSFKAGINEKDWQVRDRKMNVFAKDLPLKDLIESIARVMKFQWAIGGNGNERTYRIFMDRKTELEAEGKRVREQEKREKELVAKREDTLKEFSRADTLSEAELAQLKKDKPFDYLVMSSGIAGGLGAVFKEAPEAMQALASGKPFSMRGAQMSPAAQNGLLKALHGIADLTSRMGMSDMAVPEGIAGNMSNITLNLNQNMESIASSPLAGMMLGELTINYGDKSFDLPFLDPDSKMANILGKAALKSQEEGRTIDEVTQGMVNEIGAAFMADMKRDELGGETLVVNPDDPALDKIIKLEPKGKKLEYVQQALHESSEFTVVSDSFGSTWDMLNVDIKGEMFIKDALKAIGYLHYNWWKRGNLIEFRDRQWYKKRAAQIPDAWLDEWKKALKDTGTLDISDLAEMASLTSEQVDANIGPDEEFSRSGVQWSISQHRDFLRLYACLTKTQKAAVFSESGLSLSGLSADQWPKAETFITQRGPAFLTNPEAKLVLTGTKDNKAKQYQYSFTLTTSEELTPVKYGLVTPGYVEPTKQPEKPTTDKPKDPEPAK